MKIGRKALPHGGNGKLPGGITILRLHHKDGLTTDRTGKPVIISEPPTYLWHESHKEFDAQFTVIIWVTVNAVQSPTECVKITSPTTENGYENCIYSMNNIHTSDEDNKA